jgi:hypothetical protein
LSVLFPLSSDKLVEGKRAGDLHELCCPQITIGGIVFDGKNFSVPAGFSIAAISQIPTEECRDINRNNIDNQILAAQYKIIEDLPRDEMQQLIETMENKRMNRLNDEVCLMLPFALAFTFHSHCHCSFSVNGEQSC